MSEQDKPSVVFAHGLWADGSCFSKLIPTLRAEGHECITAEYGLDSHQGDVDCTVRALGRVSSPAILVGHSYGGSVITAAGTDTASSDSSTSAPWHRTRRRHRRASRTSSQ